MKQVVFLFSFLLLCKSLSAQSMISGRVIDATDNSPIIGAIMSLQSEHDTSKKKTVTDQNGNFSIGDLYHGKYQLAILYPGYQRLEHNIVLKTQTYIAGDLKLNREPTTLQAVIVKDKQIRAWQSGDTTQFNADAFKVNPDASAEDLIKKMPGITSDNNGLKSNGEDIKKVLVDGKPFFGDDPNAALKNLPAEIVDKIQIFDNQSDQARFTGVRDINAEKAINITTKSGKNAGQFGKIYSGYGTGNRYQAGGNLNVFNGTRRFSLLALSNNINQQNFSISDIMNVMSNSGGQGGSGTPMGPPPSGMMGNNAGRRIDSKNSTSGPGALLVGQQSGITVTQSAGMNYSDSWDRKINISGSYFFNYTDNDNHSDLVRKYFNDAALIYTENSIKKSANQNHRLNIRMEYLIDSQNAIIVTPRLTIQKNKYKTVLNASNIESGNVISGTTGSNDSANNAGYSFTNNILYQHRFRKNRRTISLNVTTQLNGRDGNGAYRSLSEYGSGNPASVLDQHYSTANNDETYSATFLYTEPIGVNSQLMYSYMPSYTTGKTNKETRSKDISTDEYTNPDTSLSNRYNNTYQTHRNGLTYKYQKGKANISIGADMQIAKLEGMQEFPVSFNTSRNFKSILPNASFDYRISKAENLFVMYRTTTNVPTLGQLQNVLDVSNPLQLTAGNPQLDQTYEHSLMARYGRTNTATSKNFFVFVIGNHTSDHITNATFIPSKDTSINNYTVSRGSQLTLPVNLDGYWSGKVFGVYSLPIGIIKSNLNLDVGMNYTRTPALLNNVLNYSNSLTWSSGFYIGSNISQNLDFSLSYNGNYNKVRNTVQIQSNNSYYYHTAKFKINWILHGNIVLNTDINHTLYNGLEESFNQDFFLWNASVGYKFLKSKALEAKFYVFDILNQNKSVSRDITDTYTQDNITNVLRRYAMLSLSYTLRNFKNGSKQPESDFVPPPGLPPPPKD